MKFVAVMKTEPDGRVAKYQDFDTEADALAHVDKFKDRFPGAFVTQDRAENILDWKVSGKSVGIEMRPPDPPQPEPMDFRNEIMALKARLEAVENRSNPRP